MTTTKYRDMIANICAKMFAIRPYIHPANRHAVDKYLQTVWHKITTLTLSFVNANQPDSLQERFRSYVEAEEKRLREGLETVRYDIDAMDTLLLVTGPGRIEKVVGGLVFSSWRHTDKNTCRSISSLSCGFFFAETLRSSAYVGTRSSTGMSCGTQPTRFCGPSTPYLNVTTSWRVSN